MDFITLLQKARKGNVVLPERLLALDPGNTTGWCLFEKGKLTKWGQIDSVVDNKIVYSTMRDLFVDLQPDRVVCENYRVYQHKLEQHAFSEVLTVRTIGFIEAICQLGLFGLEPIPIYFQMAQEAKGFCNDKKLEMWGYWQKGMKHSRDAIRHACYWLLFNSEVVKDESNTVC